MSERESWNDLRERRMDSTAARAGYAQARLASEIGRMVRELREARGLSQRALAGRMGTTQSVVGRLEAGGSRPTIVTLDRVASALGVRMEVRFHEPQGSPKPPARRPTGNIAHAASRR
jgi:transcriptional regulator with XRE-family HTH domain